MAVSEVETPRLRLRRWREADREPFAAMNADPAVMEHFPAPFSREESDAAYQRVQQHWADHGFGLWVVEIAGRGEFAGTLGLKHVAFTADFTPCVELGYRFVRSCWGNGFATEASGAAVKHGFDRLGLDEIVAFTIPINARSRRVMEKTGMQYAGDFDHPEFPDCHAMRRHVLYRLPRQRWVERNHSLPQASSTPPTRSP
jgi:RimJ/RimL family protein N-acetyltransferase